MARMSKKTILSTLVGATITSLAAPSFADVVLQPNTIEGEIRFSNTNPVVQQLLQQQLGMGMAYVVATSTAPEGYSAQTQALDGNPLSRLFEFSAESGGGVTYRIDVKGLLYNYNGSNYSSKGDYEFQQFVTLPSYDQQPGGVTGVIIEDCVGLVHVRWGLALDQSGDPVPDPQCNTPFQIHSGSISTNYSHSTFQNTSEHYIFQRGGTIENRDLFMTRGTDPTWDTITYTIPLLLNSACDEIQELCIDMYNYPGAGSGQLGPLTGPFDVVGEIEHDATSIYATDGPSGNQRYNSFMPPEMPISPSANWWVLPNMVPGDYYGFGAGVIRTGRSATMLHTPRMGLLNPAGPMTVQAGVSSDLQKSINGEARYPFVMHPARFVGEILLADPAAANGGSYSSLSSLRFSTDPPWNTQYPLYTWLQAYDRDTNYGQSVTSFDGSFDTSIGALSSVYEQLVVNTYDLPTRWQQAGGLHLDFSDLSTERSGIVNIVRDPAFHLLEPGDAVTIDHKYCFNEVTLSYSIANGLLFDPSADVIGAFNGTDWQSNTTEYTVNGTFYGWPKTSANAASNGTVHLALPQGTYTIQPGAGILAQSGSTSSATFAKTTVVVECGQALDCPPGLCVSVDLPLCALSATPDLTGTITSNGEPVERIWYEINGGPEIDICASNCGANPSYSVPVNLVACSNSIQVFASANGQTASITTTTTWADPNDNIVCEGSCEPPLPPETCATLQAEPLVCVGGDGGYVLTLNVTNQSNEPISHVLLTDPHVSPHILNLPSSLQPGESTAVSITVTGVNPGAGLCLDVGLTNESHEACCSKEVCVDIPGCCFSIENDAAQCIPGGSKGEFSYSFEFENHTLDVIEHVFIMPPDGSGITVSPDYVDVPSTLPGGFASVGPLSFWGATPGEKLCVTVGIHDEELNQCCADEVCFVVPVCGIVNPPPGEKPVASANAADGCTVGDASSSSSPSAPGAALVLVILGGLVRRSRLRTRRLSAS